MSLPCLKACPGEIKSPRGDGRRSGWWYEGDEVACPLCEAPYVVAFTDSHERAQPYLVAKERKP